MATMTVIENASYTPEQIQEIGRRLKDARLAKNLSQWQLCHRVGIKNTKVLAGYELGIYPIKKGMIQKFAAELEVTPDYILNGKKKVEVIQPVSFSQILADASAPDISSENPKPPVKHTKKYAAPLKEYTWMRPDVFSEQAAKAEMTSKDCMELLSITDKTSFYNWKKGSRRIAYKYLYTLAEYFGIDANDLIDNERNIKEPIKDRGGDKKAKASIDTHTPIIVTMEEENKMDTTAKEIPESAELSFVKNCRYYISELGLDEGTLLEDVNAEKDFFDLVIKHNCKIPLNLTLKISRALNRSVEELVLDDKASAVEREILEYEKKIAALKAKIGIK